MALVWARPPRARPLVERCRPPLVAFVCVAFDARRARARLPLSDLIPQVRHQISTFVMLYSLSPWTIRTTCALCGGSQLAASLLGTLCARRRDNIVNSRVRSTHYAGVQSCLVLTANLAKPDSNRFPHPTSDHVTHAVTPAQTASRRRESSRVSAASAGRSLPPRNGREAPKTAACSSDPLRPRQGLATVSVAAPRRG